MPSMPRRFANGSGSSSSSGSEKADESASASASVGRRKKAQHKAKAMIDRMKLKSLKKKRQPRAHPDLCAMPEHLHERVQELEVLSDDEGDGDGEAQGGCAETAEILKKNKNNPWFNEDIASIVRLCRKYRRKHHKSKTKKTGLKQICKELEKKKRKLIRAAKQKWNETQKFCGRAPNSPAPNCEADLDPPTPPLLPAQPMVQPPP